MSDTEGSFGAGNVPPTPFGKRRGPYGTNLGDIWSGEDSEVGKMLMDRDGLVMIHEVMNKDGKVQECIYNVAENNPDPEMQDLIKNAREGTELWVAEQASRN
jgi:hypothetical protein